MMARSEIVTTGLHQQTVTGAVTIGVQHEHVYELTGGAGAVVTLDGFPGAQVAIVWSGTAGTVAGQAVADGETWVAVLLSSGWRMYEIGGPTSSDTVPPSWAATVTVGTPSDTTVDVTVSALASDEGGVVGYAVSYDGGSTWEQIVPVGSVFTLTGVEGMTYSTTRLSAVDAAGNRSTPLVVPPYTMAGSESWGTLHTDSFDTHPDGSIIGLSLEQGGLTWESSAADPTILNPLAVSGGVVVGDGADARARLTIPAQDRIKVNFKGWGDTFHRSLVLYFACDQVVRRTNNMAVGWAGGYRVEVKSAGIAVEKVEAGVDDESRTALASITAGWPLSAWTDVEITVESGEVDVKIDGVSKLTHAIAGYTVPANAFLGMMSSGAQMDDFVLRVA